MRLKGRGRYFASAILVAASTGCSPTPMGTPAPDGSVVATGQVPLQYGGLDALREGRRDWPPPTFGATVDESVRPPRGSILVGWLDEARLVAVGLDALLGAAREKGRLKADLVTPVVGSPDLAAVVDDDVILTASNHRQLVRLRGDWGKPEALSVAPAIRSGDSILGFGALVRWKNSLLLTVDYFAGGDRVAVLDVDPIGWAIRRVAIWDDRFGSYPSACLAGDGTLGLLTMAGDGDGRLDLIDPESLRREASIRVGKLPGGLACANNEFWVTDAERPAGVILRTNGTRAGSFKWRGGGSTVVSYSPEHSRVVGTDPYAGVVFSCEVASRRCTTSERIGRKPTSLLILQGKILVCLELSEAIAILDARTLRLEGTAPFPGPPRTLTFLG